MMTSDICIKCMISSASDSLGCVVLLHLVNDLSNITVREVNNNLIASILAEERIRFLLQSLNGKMMDSSAFNTPATLVKTIVQPSKCKISSMTRQSLHCWISILHGVLVADNT